MELTSRVAKVLHDEHIAVISLMEKLQNFAAAQRPTNDDGTTNRFLGDLIAAIEGEVTDHFAFEENDLFPIIDDEGAGDMCDLLAEEHSIIVPLGNELVHWARQAKINGFTEESWANFKRLGNEYSERLSSHAQKEEMSLVLLVDEVIDEELDRELEQQYLLNR